MKIVTTICQNFAEIDGSLILTSQEILSTKIVSDEKVITMSNIRKFSVTELRYGIILFRKAHPLAALYRPGAEIKVNIEGVVKTGRFHNSQCRINALTALFREANVDTSKKYAFFYNDENKCIVFKEIKEEKNELCFVSDNNYECLVAQHL